ncbi:MAG: hypothetical protein ABW321_26860 [Polyangiales bacterium]
MSTIRTANLDDKTLYHLYDENEFSDGEHAVTPVARGLNSKHPWMFGEMLAKRFLDTERRDVSKSRA